MRGAATVVNQASQAPARILTSVGRAGMNAAKEAFTKSSDKVLQVSRTTLHPEGSVWRNGPVVRGEIIEQQLGQNLPKAFPVIDKFERH